MGAWPFPNPPHTLTAAQRRLLVEVLFPDKSNDDEQRPRFPREGMARMPEDKWEQIKATILANRDAKQGKQSPTEVRGL